MKRSLKLSIAAFAGSLMLSAAAAPAKAVAADDPVCRPKACDLEGGAAICCLISGEGSLTCSPCGGSDPVKVE